MTDKLASRIAKPKKATTLDIAVRTLRLRVKDRHGAFLDALACEANFVWNFCNEHSFNVLRRENRFCSAYDIHPYLSGAHKEGLKLHSQTVQAIADQFVSSRVQAKKAKLRWRSSHGARKSLGWIPFKASGIAYKSGQVWFGGKAIGLWDSYGLASYDFGAGEFCQDSRGRWYLSIKVEARLWPKVDKLADLKASALGIDLGLKSLMTDSEGLAAESQRFHRDLEPKIKVAQRAGDKARMRALHAKAKNRRRDFAHKLSTSQVKNHLVIFVGDVDAMALGRGKMAKSVFDAGWGIYKDMLRYKCESAGAWFKEIDERYSTRECGNCASLAGPKGREGLAIRQWTCGACGMAHDRDVNSAKIIRDRGLLELEMEFQGNSVVDEAPADDSIMKEASKEAGVGRDPLAEEIDPAMESGRQSSRASVAQNDKR